MIRKILRLVILSKFVLLFPGVLSTADKIPLPDTPQQMFEKFWLEAKSTIYPARLEKKFFTDENYQRLLTISKQAKDIDEMAAEINRFLEKLNVSHTAFYTHHDIEYYLFRSMFSTKDINNPKVWHVGAQFKEIDNEFVVREVVNGYPADKIGLLRGDVILESNAQPFDPYFSFNPQQSKSTVKLKIKRNGKVFNCDIIPVFENPSYSFSQGVLNSVEFVKMGRKKIGYVRLWTGINPKVLENFVQVIENRMAEVDGIILDLRGGYGGAWYSYLDPFFENRNGFYSFTALTKDGDSNTYNADQNTNSKAYKGPMVVLINEGVRSGKEALAFQFKKSARATLVGSTTRGAFTAGKGIFNEQENYFLFVSSAEYLLDGKKIEGVGVSPDIEVAYPLDSTLLKDPQLVRAKLEMRKLLKQES